MQSISAIELLRQAVREQIKLEEEPTLQGEIVECSVPILWFGEPKTDSWVTIGTNPSDREFSNQKGHILRGKNARMYCRPEGISLTEYLKDDSGLNETLLSYNKYFENNPYGWFGKFGGGKLESVLNGLGGSFYKARNFHHVVHTDFLPYATKTDYSKLVKRNPELESRLMRSSFAQIFLDQTILLLQPSLIILAGKQNIERYRQFDLTYKSFPIETAPEYPAAKFEIGMSKKYNSKVLGMYIKPSEIMVGLGPKYGTYQSKNILFKIGTHMKKRLWAT